MHLGDARATDGALEVPSADEPGRHFEREFTMFAELYQREYTFARSPRSLACSVALSRTVRIYSYLPQVELGRCCSQVGVVGQLLGPATPSDHWAVRSCSRGRGVPPPRLRLARRMAESIEFQKNVTEMMEDYAGPVRVSD